MHVKCVPGLEKLVCDELRTLRISSIYNHGTGLVVGKRVNTRQVYLANTTLRTASRILIPACTFKASSFVELERAVVRLREEHISPFIREGCKLNMHVKCAPNSPLWHTKVNMVVWCHVCPAALLAPPPC
jgi:23S rRNA G2445 N2-methylase RlmL